MVSKKLLRTVNLPEEIIKVKAFGYEKHLHENPPWELRGHKLIIYATKLEIWEFTYENG